MKVSTKFKADTIIRCLVIALLLLIRYVTLWHCDLELGQRSYMEGHVVNPFTKFEDPTATILELSSDISHRIPLTMHLQPLRMRRITWPIHRGKFSPHIWNPWPRFAYSLYNFYSAMMMFKGRLLLAPLMLKLFFDWKKYRLSWAPKWRFWGKRGCRC